MLLTDIRDIGPFVARIIKDPRTLNKFVFTYSDFLSKNEIFALMEEMSGEKIEQRKYVSADNILTARNKAAADIKADPANRMAQMMHILADYNYSKYEISYLGSPLVRADNTPAYAKYLGYLDARELDFVGEC
ncbi:hypothetical protein B0H14DRAFT_2837632 [Mycena olivaceomarginata]|nr:hypothetical protein B0H14DRAFT_2837632 [Mycena olivaceomarginata]